MSQQPDATSTCLFCRVAAGTVPATIVHSDETTVAFRDINPQAPTHILVIPRRHIPTAAAASDENVWQAVMSRVTQIALGENLGERGYRLVINSGPDAGQSVDHLHVHVLGGRHMTWPPG
jgi:histidine triad (HIT) family protein